MTESDQTALDAGRGLRGPAPSKALRPPKIWGFWATVGWGAGAFAVLAAGQIGAAILYLAWEHRLYPHLRIDLRTIGGNGPLVAVVTIVTVPLLMLFLFWAVRRSHTPLAEYLGYRLPSLREAIIGVFGLFGVIVLGSLLASAAGEDTPSFMTDTYASGRAAGLLPLLAAAFAVAAPIGEETLFRGFLYRGFAQSLGVPAAIAVTAVLWAAMHIQYNWFFVFEILLLGLFFGWVRWRSGSTLLTMALHATVNASALVGLILGQT